MNKYKDNFIIPHLKENCEEQSINEEEFNLFKNQIENFIKSDEININEPAVLNFTVFSNKNNDEYTGYITVDFNKKDKHGSKEAKIPFIKTHIYNKDIDKMMIKKYKKLIDFKSKIYKDIVNVLKSYGFSSLCISTGSLEDLNFEIVRL
jgi:hypothetical protein